MLVDIEKTALYQLGLERGLELELYSAAHKK